MKFNLKSFAVILTVSTLGFGCASPVTRVPASYDAMKGTSSDKRITVSLDPGTWCYAIYQGSNAKDLTTVVEIKSAVNDQCPSDPRATATLGRDISLELITVATDSLHRPPLVMFEVAPVTTTQLLAGPDGSTNQWPIVQMKNGVVKFYNDARSAGSMGGTATKDSMKNGVVKFYNDAKRAGSTGGMTGGNSGIFLELPNELADIVLDAAKGKGSVIIIIRDEVQEGKKGLNAVNVKLASLMNKANIN